MSNNEKSLKEEIIKVGKRLYETSLAVARSGNLSARLDGESILITASGTTLGELGSADIVRVDLSANKSTSEKSPSSELPLHALIYKNFSQSKVIHCHPPLTNAYFAANVSLKALTFETKFYLGNVPVVEQDTPTVTKPEIVIDALKTSNLVVLKNHGVVSMGDNFADCLSLVEALEEAVKVAAVARIFKKDVLDDLDRALRDNLAKDEISHPMFSKEHIQAIVDLVNTDEFIAKKGQELDLTLKLAIKLEASPLEYRFNFEKGHITKLDFDCDAPFVISAGKDAWESVFLGKLDPFVAVTQGKMKLTGQIGQLSRWYVPFSRLFELFRQVKFK